MKGDGTEAVFIDPDFELGPGQWTQIGGVLDAPRPATPTAGSSSSGPPGPSPTPPTPSSTTTSRTTAPTSRPSRPTTVDAFGTVPVLVETADVPERARRLEPLRRAGLRVPRVRSSPLAAPRRVDRPLLRRARTPRAGDLPRHPPGAPRRRGDDRPARPDATPAPSRSPTRATRRSSSASPGPGRARPAPGGGQYGLFYTSLSGGESAVDAWVFGLQQSAAARSNLAIVNAGVFNEPIRVRLEVFNGATGQKVSEETIGPLAPGQWLQKNAVLGGVANGYVHLTVVEGFDAFFAYGVVNDGATSSSGTNDGSYVPMTVVQ